MTTISNDQLAAVTGGVDWAAAHATGKEWGGIGAGVGMAAGATGGTVAAGLPGTLFFGAVGTLTGLGAGYAAGVTKGVVDSWNK